MSQYTFKHCFTAHVVIFGATALTASPCGGDSAKALETLLAGSWYKGSAGIMPMRDNPSAGLMAAEHEMAHSLVQENLFNCHKLQAHMMASRPLSQAEHSPLIAFPDLVFTFGMLPDTGCCAPGHMLAHWLKALP